MFWTYFLYGLRLAANQPIPNALVEATTAKADVQICFAQMPPWLDDWMQTAEQWFVSSTLGDIDENGKPLLTIWTLATGGYFRFHYADNTEFVIDRSGSQVWAAWPDTLSLEDTATYLLGPIMGFVLLLRGTVALHASVVVIDNQAIALIGSAGAGKSTTAAAFAHLGYRILTEDVAALGEQAGQFLIQPGYPYIRLWPSSVQILYGDADALPHLTPNWDKRYLDLTQTEACFHPHPVPLRAIYLLDERRDMPEAPFVQALAGKQGVMSLVANTYASRYMGKEMRAHEFALLSRLAARIPLRQVVPHTDPAYLSKLCDVIIQDFRGIST